GALLLGVVLGLIVAIIRTAHDSQRAGKRNPVLGVVNFICSVYLTVIRGTPMMVQLLDMGFVIMQPREQHEALICGIITLGINSGAYVAEIAPGPDVDQRWSDGGRPLAWPELLADHALHHYPAG